MLSGCCNVRIENAGGDALLKKWAVRKWNAFAEALQPGRAPIVAAVVAAMAASALAAVLLSGTARLAAALVFAVLFIGGGLFSGWLLEPRHKVYSAFCNSGYPPLPRSDRVYVSVEPEGLVIRPRSTRLKEVLRFGMISAARVAHADDGSGRASLELRVRDRITQSEYPVILAFQYAEDASEVFWDLNKERYEQADAAWAMWRTVHVDLPLTESQLRKGVRRTVAFTRQIACPRCGGVPQVRPGCPTCGGEGVRKEMDIVEVNVPPGTQYDQTFVFEWQGNEDINGRRGAVVVRIVPQVEESFGSWPDERGAENQHLLNP
jgi:hypothetical protein